MPVKPKEIVEHFEAEEKAKDQQKALVAKSIAEIEEEIEMLGRQRTGRQERHAKALEAAMQECDKRADYLIRRKDRMTELLESMNGNRPEPFTLITDDAFVLDKKPARGKPGRFTLSFGGKKTQTA